jgi:PIN domain nuclease of toxin-antitoxin system
LAAVVAYLDTHVVAWLFAGEIGLLTERARALVRESSLLVSPAVRLELQFLYEIGRTRSPARTVLRALGDSLGLGVCDAPFERVVEAAERQGWTRDPFDRLIVAQAMLARAALVTKDRTIHAHYAKAAW